jgi:hypothetical protein
MLPYILSLGALMVVALMNPGLVLIFLGLLLLELPGGQ